MSKSASEIAFLAGRLRALREGTGLTQEQFAEAAGFSYKVYQSIEAGRRWNLRISTLHKLGEAHGLTLSELFAAKIKRSRMRQGNSVDRTEADGTYPSSVRFP